MINGSALLGACILQLFLPLLLRTGIYTIPEFLEYRFSSHARSIMSFYMMVIYVGVTISAVLYSGGLTINTIFGLSLTQSVWIVDLATAMHSIRRLISFTSQV